MKIPPSFTLLPETVRLIAAVDAQRLHFNSLTIPTPIKQNLQRATLLKSSLFSARIEGNTLTEEEIKMTGESKKNQEIFNILKAYQWLEKNAPKKITKKTILMLHQRVMNDLTSDAGTFRKEMGAIFNAAGIAVYVAPSPIKINELVNRLLSYINSEKKEFPLIIALIAHLIFEKIHPFIDGNGRVGRLLIPLTLKARKYDFGVPIPFEEYIDNHKDEYYYHLDKSLIKTDDYLIFMLTAYYEGTQIIKKSLKELENIATPLLPPRQEEIYNIIKDHPLIPFDAIRRRFLKVPERTLRYDLKKLQEAGLIIKIGKTRGSYYKSH